MGSPFRTPNPWKGVDYMQLRSKEAFRTFVFTKEDKEAILAGRPFDGKKMRQCVVAERAGVSPAFIAHLASGYRTSCKPETAQAIADVLGVNLLVLFEPKVSISKQPASEQKQRTRRARVPMKLAS